MLLREIIYIYSDFHTELINTLCGQNAGLLNAKTGGTYSYHCVLKFVVQSF
jgi:hypothetical protein